MNGNVAYPVLSFLFYPCSMELEKQEHELGSSAINICIHGLPSWGKKSLPYQEEFPNEWVSHTIYVGSQIWPPI